MYTIHMHICSICYVRNGTFDVCCHMILYNFMVTVPLLLYSVQNSSLCSSQQLTHYRPKPAEDVREQQVLEQVKSLQETLNEDMSQLKKELKETNVKVCGVM